MNIARNSRLKKNFPSFRVENSLGQITKATYLLIMCCAFRFCWISSILFIASTAHSETWTNEIRAAPMEQGPYSFHLPIYSSIGWSNDWLIDWKLNRVQSTQSTNQSSERLNARIRIDFHFPQYVVKKKNPSPVFSHSSRLYFTGAFLFFSNSNAWSTVSSLPDAFRKAFVQRVLRGFFFFLKARWHFDRQNLNIWEEKKHPILQYTTRRIHVQKHKTDTQSKKKRPSKE